MTRMSIYIWVYKHAQLTNHEPRNYINTLAKRSYTLLHAYQPHIGKLSSSMKWIYIYTAIRITLISFSSAGTPAMLRSEVNDINTNMAATLVCNIKDEAKRNYYTNHKCNKYSGCILIKLLATNAGKEISTWKFNICKA